MQNKKEINSGMMKEAAFIEAYKKVGKQNINPNIVRKRKGKLKKYGAWVEGHMRLSEVQQKMVEQGRSKIEEVGVREFCRQMSTLYGISENNIRVQYADLLTYGVL